MSNAENQKELYALVDLMDKVNDLVSGSGKTQEVRAKEWDDEELERRVREFFAGIIKEGVVKRDVSPKWTSLLLLCNVAIEYAKTNPPAAFIETIASIFVDADSVVNRYYASIGQPTLNDVLRGREPEGESKESSLAIMYVSNKDILESEKFRAELTKLKMRGISTLLFTNNFSVKSGPLVTDGLIDLRCCFKVKDEEEFDRVKENIHPFLLANLGVLPPDLAMDLSERPEKAS